MGEPASRDRFRRGIKAKSKAAIKAERASRNAYIASFLPPELKSLAKMMTELPLGKAGISVIVIQTESSKAAEWVSAAKAAGKVICGGVEIDVDSAMFREIT